LLSPECLRFHNRKLRGRRISQVTEIPDEKTRNFFRTNTNLPKFKKIKKKKKKKKIIFYFFLFFFFLFTARSCIPSLPSRQVGNRKIHLVCYARWQKSDANEIQTRTAQLAITTTWGEKNPGARYPTTSISPAASSLPSLLV
jgi:hypothetical protein